MNYYGTRSKGELDWSYSGKGAGDGVCGQSKCPHRMERRHKTGTARRLAWLEGRVCAARVECESHWVLSKCQACVLEASHTSKTPQEVSGAVDTDCRVWQRGLCNARRRGWQAKQKFTEATSLCQGSLPALPSVPPLIEQPWHREQRTR